MKKALFAVLFLALAVPALAQQNVVAGIRRQYPTPLGERHGAFLVEVACAVNKGLLRKDWGTFVRLADGTAVSQDIVMDRDGTHYDILGDGEGAAIPAWQLVTEPPKVDPARYYAPVCNNTPPQPTPPTPTIPPNWVEELVAAMADAENALRAELKALRQEVAELKARPFPVYVGTVNVLGRPLTLTLEPRK